MPKHYIKLLALRKSIYEQYVLPFVLGAESDKEFPASFIIKHAITHATASNLPPGVTLINRPYYLKFLDFYKSKCTDPFSVTKTIVLDLLHDYLKPVAMMQLKPYSLPKSINRDTFPKTGLLSLPIEIQQHIISFLDHRSLINFSIVNKATPRFFHPNNSKQFTLCYLVGNNIQVEGAYNPPSISAEQLMASTNSTLLAPTFYQAIQWAFSSAHYFNTTDCLVIPSIWLVAVARPLEKINFKSCNMNKGRIAHQVFATDSVSAAEITPLKGIVLSHHMNAPRFAEYQIHGQVNVEEIQNKPKGQPYDF